MSENSKVIIPVEIRASQFNRRLFRNSTGKAWAGEGTPVKGGGVFIKNPRRISFGLVVGGSDLIGWNPLKITPDMVGQTIAQFYAVECKTKEYKKTTEDQMNFLQQVANAGGLAEIAREQKNGEIIVDIIPKVN